MSAWLRSAPPHDGQEMEAPQQIELAVTLSSLRSPRPRSLQVPSGRRPAPLRKPHAIAEARNAPRHVPRRMGQACGSVEGSGKGAQVPLVRKANRHPEGTPALTLRAALPHFTPRS